MELKKIDKEKVRAKLIPILVGVTIFILTLTFLRTTLINLFKLYVENRQEQKKLASLKRKTQLLQSLDEEEVETRAQKLEEVFPSEKPVLNLIASLIELAQEEGVTFSGVELNPGKIKTKQAKEEKRTKKEKEEEEENKKGDELKEFTIGFTIDGPMDAITAFISQLEQTSPLMKIETISLSFKGPSAGLDVKVYYQAPPESLGPIGQEVPLLTKKEQNILEEIAHYRKLEVVRINAPVGKENLFSLP